MLMAYRKNGRWNGCLLRQRRTATCTSEISEILPPFTKIMTCATQVEQWRESFTANPGKVWVLHTWNSSSQTARVHALPVS